MQKRGFQRLSIVRERIHSHLPPSCIFRGPMLLFAKTDQDIRGFRSQSELKTKLGKSGGPTGLDPKIGLNLHAELCLEAILN